MIEISNVVEMRTPIEIALDIDSDGMTTARKLYDFLEMPTQNFSRWAKTNIENNEFYEENKDWWGFFIMKNGNECKDYKLSTDFAKHLSMESHSARVREISIKSGIDYQTLYNQLYGELETTAHCSLKRLQENKKKRMEKAGNTKTAIKEATTKIAIVYEKPQLKAIFENIVKKYAMSYCA